MTPNVARRTLLVLAGALVLLTAVMPTSAQAAPAALVERDGEPVVMTLSGTVVVAAQEVVDDIWVANGRAIVDGRVEGSVVILKGGAVVRGSVGGDVTVVSGGVFVGRDAVVRGDIQASKPVTVAEGAVVEGSVTRESVLGGLGSILPMLRTALWIWLTVALLALGLVTLRLAGDTIERARGLVTARPFGSAVRGLAVLVLLPLLALIAIATVVGGLLGLLLVALAALTAIAGLIVSATAIGRWLLPKRSALLAFIVGALILQVVALVPLVGTLVTVIATLVGTGALVQALRDARHDEKGAQPPTGADQTDATSQRAARAIAGAGINLDLRPGPPPTPAPAPDPGWLSPIVAGASSVAPVLDLGEDAPTIELPDDQPVPEILASLPVREDSTADDAQGAPGNGERRSSLADPFPGEPAATDLTAGETESGSYPGPRFTVADPARMLTDGGGTAPRADTDRRVSGLSFRATRAQRPSQY